MRFSLIVPTLDRPDDVKVFLKALTEQSTQDLEVIIVDQSGSNIYDQCIQDFVSLIPIKHIRLDIKKCRYACIVGASYATGDIIAFPDDDCFYCPETLRTVDLHFQKTPDLALLTGRPLNLEGVPSRMGRWLTRDTVLNKKNIWIGLIEFNMFIRRDVYEKIGGFDPNMGPGCRFVAAEGQDLGLRILSAGYKGYFDSNLHVVHPDKDNSIIFHRAYGYAQGMGYALRKNHASISTITEYIIRPCGGAILSILQGKIRTSLYYLTIMCGRISGYCSSEAARQSLITK